MQTIEQAIAALGSAIGLEGAELDGNGNMTLVVDGGLDVNLAKQGGASFEFWTRLPGLGSADDASLLSFLLASNHLGDGAGAARLALTPDRSAVVLCERVDVAGLDGAALATRLTDFIRYASFWRSPDARRLADASGSRSDVPDTGHDGLMFRA